MREYIQYWMFAWWASMPIVLGLVGLTLVYNSMVMLYISLFAYLLWVAIPDD